MNQTNQKISIAIACNRRLFREFLCIALKDEEWIDIGAEVENLHSAIDMVREHKPDVILLDIAQTKFNIAGILSKIANEYPETKVLIFAQELKDEELQSFIKAGARGYISTKHSSIAYLIRAIKSVQEGEFWIERKLVAKLLTKEYNNNLKTDEPAPIPKEILTAREKEILSYLSKGFTNKEIASSLFISDKTVKCHLNRIFKKLNITNRFEALVFTIKNGLLQQTDFVSETSGYRT